MFAQLNKLPCIVKKLIDVCGIASPIGMVEWRISHATTGYKPMYNDAVIANKVREAILLNPRVSAQDLTVSCQQRVVSLLGDVDTPEQEAEAVQTAEALEGVVRVENYLHVRSGRWPPVEPEILPWSGGR